MGLFDRLFKRTKETSIVSEREETFQEKVTTNDNIPSFQGNYAKAIFLNAYQYASLLKDDNDYQRYLIYECGIESPAEFHKRMIREGYLQESSLMDNLNVLKVSELKQILESVGAKKTGKKDELIERVLVTIDKEESQDHVACEKRYSISAQGKAYLEEHKDYILIHQHRNWGIDWQDYDKRKKKTNYRFYDVVWGILNERVLESQNFGRNEYLNMYQLLIEEKKTKRALEMLLTVLYIDLSGVEGRACFDLYMSGVYDSKRLSECFNIVIMIAPGIIADFATLTDVYEDGMIERLYNSFRLPMQLCPQNLFVEIVRAAIHGEFDEPKYEQLLKNEYQQYISQLKRH